LLAIKQSYENQTAEFGTKSELATFKQENEKT